ncbi:DNA polymerase III subunit gamma/tau [Acinetobacter sp. ANC 4641]|uniref:DNA polymerase III subunit gamma/tau n=1 Tax=Acinetobacter sp. ANC 4641 TaxID=2529847 RepID=UPI00103CE94B|nr:DNA polymerase III subunit gamma/tau [Acinetobacter sp. ANC 4641]TCB09501.1 DNA polymerase III subunit gamma/tau [Acinetobacter sp. ANC 4641]
MYQVLARKYRPRNFNELVGQNHVARALISALERGRLHHAYLFTGTRGVGKTTIARILAKCLNCETGVTSTPCETCATCRAVNEGRFIDLIEIDAASRTKVEDTRELLDNVPYAPTQGRFKVYLIDEVHMLSTHSFNALLKTLEEPPEHVKFLFATTDPQKLPITVISRCLQFTLRPLDASEIHHHLDHILVKEQIQAEQDALWQIAEAAQGSLRDALSLTDQAIAYGQGKVQHQDVKDMLGLIDRSIIYDLILAIHQNQPQHVSQLLLQFRQQALDVALVLDQLISTLHELALMHYLPDLSLKYSQEINQKIRNLSQQVSPQDLQLYYQIACKGRSELTWAVTQEQGFEMCILRLLAFRPLQMGEVIQTVESAQSSSVAVTFETAEPEPELIDEEQSQADLPQGLVQFDALDESTLIEVDLPSAQQTVIAADLYAEDNLFPFEPEYAEPSQQTVEPQSIPSEEQDAFTLFAESDSVEVETVMPAEQLVAIEIESSVAQNLMPQDILKLPEQQLEGEWTVEKWEYWFRNSALSPAVQELAQYGLMHGQIDGVSTFHIPQQYEQLLTQQQHNLEQALKNRWENTHFSVQYGEVTQVTPYVMQHLRREKAQQRAAELIHQDGIVQQLLSTFDGDIQQIQLKHEQ